MYFSASLPKLLRSRAIQNLEFPGKASKLSLLQEVNHSEDSKKYFINKYIVKTDFVSCFPVIVIVISEMFTC